MTKYRVTDRTDAQDEPRHTYKRRQRIKLALVLLTVIVALGNRSACDEVSPPSISCTDPEMVIAPGTCKAFPNPCDPGTWVGPPRFDGFRLCDEPDGISVRTVRVNGQVEREICVAQSTPQFAKRDIMYFYGRATDHGTGSILLSVATPLVVDGTVTPETIVPGGTAQLNTFVSGGIPPYKYEWRGSSVSDPHSPNPIWSPGDPSIVIEVTDVAGQQASDYVSVRIETPTPPPTPTPTPTPTPPPLTASFFYNVTCCPTLNLDASASTGNIVSYEWDLAWTAAKPDRVTTTPTTSFSIREFDRGIITLTVIDVAGNRTTFTRNF